MTGIHRFLTLLLCVVLVMILYPDFGATGWTFAGVFVLLWTGVILIMSVVDSLFSLYRFEGINRFLSWVFIAGVLVSMLWFFPQDDKISPLNKLKYGEIPTGADIQRGLQKFSFNFAFDKRNARSDQNFINQRDPKALETEAARKAEQQKARLAAEKAKQKLSIVVED